MSNNTQKKMKQEDNKNGLMSKFRKSIRKKKETKDIPNEKTVTIVQEPQSNTKEKADSDYAKSIDSNNNRNSMYSLNRSSMLPDMDKLYEEFEKVKNEADKVKEDLEHRNQTLTNELEASKQTIEKLQKGDSAQPDNTEFDQLKIELQQKDVIVQELNSQLATIKDEFEKFKKETSERIQVEPEELNKKAVLVDNQQEIINLKSELEQRNSTIQQLTSELTATKKDDEKFSVKQEKNNDAQNKIEQLQLALNESKAENAKLLTEIGQKVNHIDQLTSDLTASQKEIKSTSNENITLKAIIEETRSSLDSSVEENAHLTTSLEKTQSLLKLKTKELNNLTNLMENSKRSLSKNTDEIADLKDDVKKGEKIINELRAELKASKVEAETAKKAVTEQQQHFDQSTKIKLEKIVAEKEEMIKENKMIAAELQNAKSEIRDLKTKKSESESAQKVLQHELKQYNSSLQELKDQLESRDQTIQNQLEMIKLTVPKDHHDSVQSELESIKAELYSVKYKHENVSTPDELREELSSTKAELKATREASEWEKSRNERIISELRHQYETLSTSLRVKEQEFEKYNALEQQYIKLQQQNDSTKMQLQQNESMKIQLQQQKQQNELMKIQLQQQNESAKTQAQKLIKENERLRTEKSKLESARKAREQTEKAQQSQKSSKTSPKISVIPIESEPIETVIDRSIGQTTSPKLQPTSTSHSNNSKHNDVVETTQTTRSVEVIPQANIMSPEGQQNVAISQSKKEEGWVTVQKRRHIKPRNSTVMT
ncbi:9347_t:CDS:2 [Diversispora eburnea]|uniref:9347_t:CDS:1 n=1 Tax=Diversispora eburnea TaxID=1213867 RepID=A0A9N8YNK1_9GLOM|nr:9347_t:CDS:2 [Diversispora eburnea]